MASPAIVTTAGQTTVNANLGRGQSVAAVLAAPVGADATHAVVIPFSGAAATLPADLAAQPCNVIFYLNGRVGMQVKRPMNGAQGTVIDHLSPTVVDKFITAVAGPEVKAVAPLTRFTPSSATASRWAAKIGPIRSWTNSKSGAATICRPLLPALFDNNFPKAADIRHDWGQTQTDMFNDNFVAKFSKFAQANNTNFRIQAYGSPAAAQSTYAFCDLPEGEMGHQTPTGFNDCRYAASATHLLGQSVCSSETFTWLKDEVFRMTPLDIKSESNWQFLQGINQFICHGWPSTADNVPYPGWTFYVAAVFNQNNPWYVAMPDVTKYLQRVSFMMRQGEPTSDVAFYLGDSDAWASFRPGTASVTNAESTRINQTGAVAAILAAGYNIDFWDDGMLAARGQVSNGTLAFGNVHYKIVVLDNVERIPLATLAKLEDFAKGGGIIVCLGSHPSIVPGYKATDADQRTLRDSITRIFGGSAPAGISLADASTFGMAVAKKLRPDVALTPIIPAIGFVHRHTDDADIYFVANTSNQHQDVVANFRIDQGNPEYWDPMTGKVSPAQIIERAEGGTSLALHLEPYGTRLVVFTHRTLPPTNIPTIADIPKPVDISTSWTVTFVRRWQADQDGRAYRLDQQPRHPELLRRRDLSAHPDRSGQHDS